MDKMEVTGGEVAVSEPDMPGAFKGDIWYGHPEKRTLATHRWDGKQWLELPSELDACLLLLAKSREALAEREAEIARLREALVMSVGEMSRARGRLEIIGMCNEDRRIAAALGGACDNARQALGDRHARA